MDSKPSPGDLVEVRIDKLVAGGEGLGRAGELVVFARPAYPGDLVRVRISESRKRFVRGAVEELLEPGPERRATACPIAGTCGGCDWTAYRLDAQLRAKRQILLESLVRIGRLPEETIPPVRIHASALDYRLRSRLHFDDQGRPGFFAFRTHEVVPIVPECEVVGPQLLEGIARGEISGTPGSEALFLESDDGLVIAPPGADSTTSVRVRGFRYRIAPGSFFQVNRHLLGTLIDLVLDHAGSTSKHELALDLYGGAGFFALPLSTRFSQVVSIESDLRAHELARVNAERRSIETRHEDVLRSLREESSRPDLILLDPPRSGTHPEVVRAIDRLDPDVVSYLSCDPVNLARDLERFVRTGWSVRTLDLVDLFPNTHHIETLVSLRRS